MNGNTTNCSINGPGSSNIRNKRQIPIYQSINKQPTNLGLDKLRPTDPRNPKQIPIDSGFDEPKPSDSRNPR
ncbi:hypothetical protein NC651_009864 [Populus alba x Populus x berolinensis]|nr:hypothetical protein NC651_009864 [Populus alba x Populus x berolinensis]